VAPPEEQQVEEIQDFSDRQPETLDENSEAEMVMIDSIDSNVGKRWPRLNPAMSCRGRQQR